MIASKRRFGVAVALMLGLVAAAEAEGPDKGTLATEIAEGRKQNHQMMLDYTWNTRTES